MLKVGITGGIGSGKSTVCAIFEKLGIPVYYADTRAKALVNSHAELQSKITAAFGENSFNKGAYNRAFIASIVFADRTKLDLLNDIIHPYVFNDWLEFCHLHQNAPYVIKEAAIMLETESKKTVDFVVLVHAPLELRIERIMHRDASSRAEIEARIKAQMPESEKLKLANAVIYNDQKSSLIEQVLILHQRFIKP